MIKPPILQFGVCGTLKNEPIIDHQIEMYSLHNNPLRCVRDIKKEKKLYINID